MKLKNGVVMSPNFTVAVEQLLKLEMTVKECVELAETAEALNDRLVVLDKAKKAIMTRFAKKDEKGEMVTQPTISDPNLLTPVFESEESATAFAEEIQKLLQEETDIPLKAKIKINSNTKMNTAYFMAIKDLVELV